MIASDSEKKHNKKMLIWFLISLAIAILPWFLLANDEASTRKGREIPRDGQQTCQKSQCPALEII